MKKIINLTFILSIMLFIVSCDDDDLPGVGSIADETPPTAAFATEADPEDYLTINFTNGSTSANSYVWDFGNGETSTDENPSSVYTDIGTYTITLTATDALGISNTTTGEITIEEPAAFIPTISEPGFEDESDTAGCGDGNQDGRDCWRNDVGGVIQITSSPVRSGEQAAKLPSDGSRVGMQTITVVPDTEFTLSFYYTMKTDPGTLTVAILDTFVDDAALVEDAVIEKVELTDNSDANTYVQEFITFNSGSNSEVVIYFNNADSECRLDDFTFDN